MCVSVPASKPAGGGRSWRADVVGGERAARSGGGRGRVGPGRRRPELPDEAVELGHVGQQAGQRVVDPMRVIPVVRLALVEAPRGQPIRGTWVPLQGLPVDAGIERGDQPRVGRQRRDADDDSVGGGAGGPIQAALM